jgi:hypothetical protein
LDLSARCGSGQNADEGAWQEAQAPCVDVVEGISYKGEDGTVSAFISLVADSISDDKDELVVVVNHQQW